MISLEQLSLALEEYDFAKRAATYGAVGNRNVLADAIKNLPTQELNELRPHLKSLIEAAVARTEQRIVEMGVEIDMDFPPYVRSLRSEPR